CSQLQLQLQFVVSTLKCMILIEIRDELLHSAQVAVERFAHIRVADRRLAAHVTDDGRKRCGVETRSASDRICYYDVVLRRTFAMQPQERAKDDHDRAQARGQQLDLSLRLVP